MKHIILSLVILLSFVGCDKTLQPDPIVQITDRCSSGDIVIKDIKERQKKDGFMQAQITGMNLTDHYFKVEYSVIWLDENDFTIDTILSEWTTIPAYPNQPFYINVTSPNTKSASFRLYLKKEGKIICNTQSN